MLAVEATFLGEVAYIPDAFSAVKNIGNLRSVVMSWQKLASGEAGIMKDAFWKIVFLDRPIVNRPKKEESGEVHIMHMDDFLAVESWWQWLPTLDPTKLGYPHIPCPEETFQNCFTEFNRIHATDTKTAFYSTNTGVVGVTNSEIRKDDCICVCKGSPIPFVLRPCDGGVYSFVGTSYVHGIMEGAAMEEAEWEIVLLC